MSAADNNGSLSTSVQRDLISRQRKNKEEIPGRTSCLPDFAEMLAWYFVQERRAVQYAYVMKSVTKYYGMLVLPNGRIYNSSV
jgi:hypothetical protein